MKLKTKMRSRPAQPGRLSLKKLLYYLDLNHRHSLLSSRLACSWITGYNVFSIRDVLPSNCDFWLDPSSWKSVMAIFVTTTETTFCRKKRASSSNISKGCLPFFRCYSFSFLLHFFLIKSHPSNHFLTVISTYRQSATNKISQAFWSVWARTALTLCKQTVGCV